MTPAAGAASPGGGAPAPAAPDARSNPFVGPVALAEGQSLHGRKGELKRLVDLLVARRIVLLYSPSGAGKTSLIGARLLPFLREERGRRFRPSPILRVNHAPQGVAPGTPGLNRYVLSILRGLEGLRPEGEQLDDARLAGMTLPVYLAERWPPEPRPEHGRRRLDLLVFDQFEEIFTLDPLDRAAKREAFRQIGEALGQAPASEDTASAGDAPPRWALFSMREDHVAELDDYRELVPTGLSTTFRLNLLDRAQAAEAIDGPAADQRVGVEPDAVERLVDDLARVRVRLPDGSDGWAAGDLVEPVQLQVVCRRVWDRVVRPDHLEIARADLDAGLAVEVDAALTAFYEDAVRAAAAGTGARERAIRDWFERDLVTPGRVRTQVLLDGGGDRRAGVPAATIEALERAHLVRIERRAGRDWVELTHDRLVEPLLQANAAWRAGNLSLVQRQAELWDDGRRAEGFLLTGAAFRDAERWAAAHAEELEPREREFLAACRALRRRGRDRLALVALCLLLVVFPLVWARSYLASFQLQREKAISQAQRKIAQVRLMLGKAQRRIETARGGAVGLALAADEEARGARAALVEEMGRRHVAPWVDDWLRRRSARVKRLFAIGEDAGDPIETLWSLVTESGAADAILIDALRSSARVRWSVEPAGGLRAVALGEDLRTFVTVSPDFRITLSDRPGAAPREDPAPPRADSLPGARSVAYGARAGLVAAVDDGDRIVVWRVHPDRLERVATLNESREGHAGRVTAIAVGARDLVASAGADRSLVVWSLGSPAAPVRLAPNAFPAYALAFDAGADRLAAADWEGNATVWTGIAGGDAPRRRALAAASEPGDTVALYSLAFDGSGRWLAGGGHDGSVLLWDVSDDAAGRAVRLRGVGGHDRAVMGLAFGGGGALASGALDRAVIVWDVAKAARWSGGSALPIRRRLGGLGEGVRAIAFDGEQDAIAAERNRADPGLPWAAREVRAAGAEVSRVLALDAAGPRSPLALSLPGTCERQGPGGRRPARWGPVALAGDLVLAACAPEVRAWRLGGDGATPVPTGIAHARLTRFAADASARVVVTVGLDGRLLAWRRAGGDRFTATPLPDPPLPTTALAVDAGGRWIAAAGFDHVRIWDASTAEPRAVATEPISMGLVRALAISPAGDRLVAAGERRAEGSKAGAPARRGVVRTWALEAGRPLSPADADLPGAIHAVAFDPSTGELYTGDDVDQVRRWTPAPLRGGGLVGASERAIVAIAAGRVTHPGAEGFPPAWDDARVVTADRLGNVVVRLSLDDERHAVTLLEGADLRRSLASDARGERLVVADEEVVVWDLRPRSIRDAACRLAAPPDEPGRANPCAGPMAARRE